MKFPFHQIPPVVIGRAYVDSIIMQTPRFVGGRLIDFTNYSMNWFDLLLWIAVNYHQGKDTFRNHSFVKQMPEDREYNKQFMRGKYVTTLKRAKFVVDENGALVPNVL